MRALLIAVIILALGGGAAVAQTAGSPARTVSLARMGSSLSGEDYIGEAQFGARCITDRTLRWSNVAGRFDDARFGQVFREAMVGGGFTVTGRRDVDLFSGGPNTNADLQLGALVRSLRLQTCTSTRDSDGMTHASASLEIEWQVYSPMEGKVVAKLYSRGSYGLDRPIAEVVTNVLSGAFKRAAVELAEDPAFIRLMRPAPIAAAAPLTALPVKLPGSRATAIAQARSSVVSIVLPDRHGSGVLVSPDGYILTNRHVAGDGGNVRVIWANGAEAAGVVLRSDRKRDVALVKVDPPTVEPLAIRHTPPQVGETVYAIGTPLDRELAGTLTRGVVSGLRTTEGQPFIQSDVVINPGNSGGPLLDETGQVIGLTVSGLISDGAPTGINFFIPIDDALRVLAIQPIVEAAPPPPQPAAAKPAPRPTPRPARATAPPPRR